MAVVTARAKQSILMVEKVDGSGTYVPVLCMDSLNFSQEVGTVEVNCRGGLEVEYDGDPKRSAEIRGAKKLVTGTDAANNVSAEELAAWQAAKLKKNMRIVDANMTSTTTAGVTTYTVTPISGSTTRQGKAMITSFNVEAGESGVQRYNVSLTFDNTGFTETVVA